VSILKGGDNIISTPSIEIDPVWRTLLKKVRIRRKNKRESTNNIAPVRRSRRIIEREKEKEKRENTQQQARRRGRPRRSAVGSQQCSRGEV
jgi:hypothetical protein